MKIFALLVALVVLVNQYVLVQGLIRDTILDDLRYSTPMVETSEQLFKSLQGLYDEEYLMEWTKLVLAISQELDNKLGPRSERKYYDKTIEKMQELSGDPNASILSHPVVKNAFDHVFDFRLIRHVDNVGKYLIEHKRPRNQWTLEKAESLRSNCHSSGEEVISYGRGSDGYKQLVNRAIDRWVREGCYEAHILDSPADQGPSCFGGCLNCLCCKPDPWGMEPPGGYPTAMSNNAAYSRTTGVGGSGMRSGLTANSHNMGTGRMGPR